VCRKLQSEPNGRGVRPHARCWPDWKIPDPRDMTPEQFRGVRDLIEQKVKDLLATLEAIP
jgi:protein-tyrosine-phosphatase